MSDWAGKYVIGLTGNIATGKSLVCRMLEQLGAHGIDADRLAHRVIKRGSPGYQPVLDEFCREILTTEGEIDRIKLANVVFSDPEKLLRLEAIIHPLVGQEIDQEMQNIDQTVVVIEAIKLIESGLNQRCDTLWVTWSTSTLQVERLLDDRKMQYSDANQRIKAQPPQELKTAQADIVINNVSSLQDTWEQVAVAWRKIFPESHVPAVMPELDT
jgi:dephospho-CoA kinase